LLELVAKLFCEEKETDVENSEEYHFFMSLISHMAHFHSVQKLQVRNKIQQVIIDMVFSLGRMTLEMSRSGF
jgi:hypothetical protein